MKIHAKRALVGGAWRENCVVDVVDGRILSVSDGTCGDLTAEILTPGLFDKHIHGGFGFNCATPDEDGCRRWLETLLSRGVTNVLMTLASCPPEMCRAAVAFAAHIMEEQARGGFPGARVMGVHMEGPFLNPVRKGGMNENCLIAPTMENFEALTGDHADVVRAITVAPELPGAPELAQALSARGIHVQAGHTDCDYACMERAAEAGFSGLTHTFNAMPGIGHRNPGPVVCGMVNDHFRIEAICDLVHLSAPVVQLLFRAKGAAGIAMISDCVTCAGLPDGEYPTDTRTVVVRNSRIFTPTGTISGSYHTLDFGVGNAVSLGIPMEDAIRAASRTPAEILGLDGELGDIAPGKRACLAAWDDSTRSVWGFDGFNIIRRETEEP